MDADDDAQMVLVGRIVGLFGVRGWGKGLSYTEPRDNILRYSPWYVCEGDTWRAVRLLDGRRHGSGIVAHLEGCTDRDAGAVLVQRDVAVRRAQLPKPAPGEYYWQDLIGLRVVTVAGEELGRVDHIMETGANDVLVVRSGQDGSHEELIPFVRGAVVTEVDLDHGLLRVDWEPGV